MRVTLSVFRGRMVLRGFKPTWHNAQYWGAGLLLGDYTS